MEVGIVRIRVGRRVSLGLPRLDQHGLEFRKQSEPFEVHVENVVEKYLGSRMCTGVEEI